MNSLNRNLMIFFLMVCVVGAFGFHWFFIDPTMPASECFSINCAYSATQAMPQEAHNFLILVLVVALFAVALSPLKLHDNEFKKLSGRFVLKKLTDVFSYKLICWLKILEKRDPRTALVAARISDFRQ